MTEKEPKGFSSAYEKAKDWINSPGKVSDLVKRAGKKINLNDGTIKKFADDVKTLGRMLMMHQKGLYRGLSTRNLVYVLAAIIYFVNPFDLVPDFLLGIGFLDDATVIAFVMSRLGKEITKFKEFEASNTIEVEALD
jgi:uncharacterized membrane protein YkvA (DUF1232 family)